MIYLCILNVFDLRLELFNTMAALFEAFGLTVVEAMTCGLPTFATKNGYVSVFVDKLLHLLFEQEKIHRRRSHTCAYNNNTEALLRLSSTVNPVSTSTRIMALPLRNCLSSSLKELRKNKAIGKRSR